MKVIHYNSVPFDISLKGVIMDLSNFQEILNFAISKEEKAIDAYGTMSEKTKAPGLKELLIELQEEERNHKKLLEGISDQKIQSFEIKEVPDLKITDYLVEEAPTEDMNFQDLLIFAAKKEQEAVDLYTNLESNAKDEELKKLFQFLIQQEKTHKLKLEKEYDEHVLEWD
jgi:rubrerythrin